MNRSLALCLLLVSAGTVCNAHGQTPVSPDSVVVRFVDADLRAVVQALAQYLDRPLLIHDIPPERVTVDHPGAVPRGAVLELIRGLLDARGLAIREDSSYYTVTRRAASAIGEAERPPVRALDLFVIPLRHSIAADVAATLNLLFGAGGTFSGRPGLSDGTLSEQLRRNVVPPTGPGTDPGRPTDRVGPAELVGPITVVPDERTNALLVRASPEDFEVLAQAVRQLDIRPLQVLIEVLVVEVRRDRSFTLGTALEMHRERVDESRHLSLAGPGTGDLVLGLMRMGRTEINALLTAGQARGDLTIVSRPALIAANNTQAHFLVGSQRPFVQVSRSLPTDTPSRDQVIQYKDVGTKLTILPTINLDGYVSLLIQQEISAATAESQFNAPVISTREARTQVLVRDSQTVVLGGLQDEQRDRFQQGIPILSAIPILGGLFGSTSRRSSATELFLFVTPRILRTDDDIDTVTAPRLPPVPTERHE